MALFRKKPVIVEAIQWTGDNSDEVHTFAGGEFYVLDDEDRKCADDPEHTASLFVAANSTWVGMRTGEWVLRDTAGSYPCRNENFARITSR